MTMHIVSLGAGVQSSAMVLMAARGEIKPLPELAIFADTEWEPQSVYKWLSWLEKQLPFPVVRVGKGNLGDAELQMLTSKRSGNRYRKSFMPAYVAVGQSVGPLMRKCTVDFKINPIVSHIRKIRGARQVILWLGISTDEVMRMKESRFAFIKHRWPLTELNMNRQDCLKWMSQNGFPVPPRSACVFCPYHNDAEWRRLKSQEPSEFLKAVEFEKKMQSASKSDQTAAGIPFLHRSCIPLSEVDFNTEEQRGQLNMFNNECEGMCGV